MVIAITRIPSASLPRCELSFLERKPIDVAVARRQHEAYRQALEAAGAQVVTLPALDELPDATFVEDTTIVVDELAVMAPMGASSRRAESDAIAWVLASYRRLHHLSPPSTLDGGDVLRLGRTLFVGETPRTNAAAVRELRALLGPLGYAVVTVPVSKCLHLKSGCAGLDDETALVNPEWVDPAAFVGKRIVRAADDEPWGANAVRVGDHVILPASAPATRSIVEARGYRTSAVDVSELQKAESGVTCLSVLIV
jgi:dimethylargininase